MRKRSLIVKIFYILAVVLVICGIVLGRRYINQSKEAFETITEKTLYEMGILYIVGGFISGLFTAGFGKVIDILENMDKNLSNLKSKISWENIKNDK